MPNPFPCGPITLIILYFSKVLRLKTRWATSLPAIFFVFVANPPPFFVTFFPQHLCRQIAKSWWKNKWKIREVRKQTQNNNHLTIWVQTYTNDEENERKRSWKKGKNATHYWIKPTIARKQGGKSEKCHVNTILIIINLPTTNHGGKTGGKQAL